MKSMLIVDDSEMFYRLMKRAIKNVKLEWAKSGEEALKLYRETKPALVLMDVVLPDMSGIEAIRKIKEFDKDAKIIVLSGIDNHAIKKDSVNAGADEYISKSAGLNYIVDKVEKELS